MGVGRIGRARPRPGSLERGADAYQRLEIPNRQADGRQRWGKAVGLILVAIIAVGYMVGFKSLFGL